MDEPLTEQLTSAATRLASAAEALENALARIDAHHQELSAKVERIVAAIDEHVNSGGEVELTARIAELERANSDLKAHSARIARKTMSPLVTAILAKNEAVDATDSVVLDKALASLSVEQRMAVKAEMARAGMIE